MARRICSIDGCNKPVFGHGWCQAHYARWSKHGDPLGGRTEEGRPLVWLQETLSIDTDDCIIWPFGRKRDGYGAVLFNGSIIGAHRAACILAHGEPDNDSLHAAHSCGRGREGCVNHKHLRWATALENSADRTEHQKLGISRKPSKKISQEIANQIRQRRVSASGLDLAREFGISESMVSRICSGERW